VTEPSDPFFIGWAGAGARDRRFLLGASLGLITAGAGAAAWLAMAHASAGDGAWDQANVREWTGHFTRDPYPALYTRDIDGAPRTAFLVGPGKRGLQSVLGGRSDGPATVRGSLIARGRHAMIATDGSAAAITDARQRVRAPPSMVEDLGAAMLIGEVLDAKCWFGAMRPGAGKVHKACAGLCIRGGLPPAFCAGDAACGDAARAPLLLDETGAAHGPRLAALAADPVRALGRLVRVADVVQFRAALGSIVRLA